MANARAAEWILARLTSPDRTAAMVGDLSEQGLSDAALQRATLQLCLRFGWTWMAAVVVAFFSFLIAYAPYRIITGAHLPHSHAVFPVWLTWASRFFLISVLLWTTPVLAAIRYGARDRIAHVGLILAVLASVGASTAWAPHAKIFLPLLIVGTLSVCLVIPALRRACLCVLAVDAVLVSVFSVIALLLDYVLTVTNHNRGGGSDGAAVVFGLTYLILQALVLAKVRSRLAPQAA